MVELNDNLEEGKIFALLAYLPPFLFLVPLLTKRDNDFALFHAKQGLVLTIACISIAFCLRIISFILSYIPIIGPMLTFILWLVFMVGGITLVITGIIKSLEGEYWEIPILSIYAKKMNI